MPTRDELIEQRMQEIEEREKQTLIEERMAEIEQRDEDEGAGMLDVLKASPYLAYSGLTEGLRGIYGGVQALEEALGTGTTLGARARAESEPRSRYLRERIAQFGFEEDTLPHMMGTAVESTGQFLPTMLAASSPLGAASLLGGQTFGTEFAEKRARGVPFERAAIGSAIPAGTVMATSPLETIPIMKGKGPAALQYLKAAIGGGVQEAIEAPSELYGETVATGEEFTKDDYIEASKRGFKYGTVATATTKGGYDLASKVEQKITERED